MEFCFSDTTRIIATDDSARGLYPAPDAFPNTTDTPAAMTATGVAGVAAVGVGAVALSLSASDAVDRDGDGDAAREAADANADAGVEVEVEVHADVMPASTLAVIEPNADIAEALQHLLQTLPGVTSVATMTTSADLVQRLTGGPDVHGFGTPDAMLADVAVPEIVFLDTGKACSTSARSNQQLRASIEELQRTLPSSALVLMSVYPDRLQTDLRGMVAACIRKDTSRTELEALITRVRASRSGGVHAVGI